jgi:hypothetical protein
MGKKILFIYFCIVNISPVSAMLSIKIAAQQKKYIPKIHITVALPELPTDIISKIVNNIEPFAQENELERNDGESINATLLLPYTIRKINFIVPHPHKYAESQLETFFPCSETYGPQDRILPEIEMRFLKHRRYEGFSELHMNIDTEKISCYAANSHIQFLIQKLLNFNFLKYDGFNIHNLAIVTTTTEKEHRIYLLEKYKYKDKGEDMYARSSYIPKELPLLLASSGYLRSCMLYPDENKVLCSVKNADMAQHQYMLSLYEIDAQHTFNLIVTSSVDHLFKKTIYLGPYHKNYETFLGLIEEGKSDIGKLALIWLNKSKKKLKYSLITFSNKLKNGTSVPRTFADIAVDESIKENKVRCKIACLNTNNELFICDLRAFHMPTLLLATEKPLPSQNDSPFRLLYDNHKYAIVWKDNNSDNFTRLTAFSDDYEKLYLTTLIKYRK